jgi:hypothetical protein
MRSVAVLVTALALAGVAAADHLDPQERILAADQTRAVAMLLRKSDLPPGHEAERTSGLEPHLTCRGLDESGLVRTGKATSPYWAREYRIVGSSAVVYRTEADSRAAWRRSTSAAGRTCIGIAFRDEFARQGDPARVSVRALAVPALSVQSSGYRVTVSSATPGQPAAVVLDVVLLRKGRAQAAVLHAAVIVPPERATQIALSRVVAKRMHMAMRGAP